MKGFYQPAGVVGLVGWAWILMIALFSLIMQLEVTHFNVWTGGLLIVFFVVAGFAIFRRRVEIDDAGFAHFTQLFSPQRLSVRITGLHQVQFTKNAILLQYNGDHYYFKLSKAIYAELKQRIEDTNA